jgi:hypothetical protein
MLSAPKEDGLAGVAGSKQQTRTMFVPKHPALDGRMSEKTTSWQVPA